MRFDLNHDWQGNMSTPQALIGQRAKTHLLLVLCAIWICIGLVGHSPWKPFESHTISTVKTVLDTGNWIAPTSASHEFITNPPLFYLSAAFTTHLLSPLLSVLSQYDAARIVTGFWMVITLLMMGMTGRELWGKGVGRQTTFILIGAMGLVVSAHTLMPAISALSGIAISFYAFSLILRKPKRASLLLSLGLSVSFLSTGLLPLAIILGTCTALPVLFNNWRNRIFFKFLAIALLIASPFLVGWPLLCHYHYPDQLHIWWQNSTQSFGQFNYLYYLKTLLWYAWPALPLAVWGFWRYRKQLLNNPKFQLIITFFAVAFGLIGLGRDNEVFALPLIIPLTAMAGGSIETLKRGTASALNWFGLLLLGLMSGLVWLGWIAMITGSPVKIKERISFLSGMTHLNFNWLAFIFAITITLIWLFAIARSQHSNRSSATNWAIGMTCVWTLLMTLWLPMIESARGYEQVFTSLKQALPANGACVTSTGLGDAQKDLVHYFTNVKTLSKENGGTINCDLYLIQDEKNREKVAPGAKWKQIWSGKRVSDRRESFRLFQRIR